MNRIYSVIFIVLFTSTQINGMYGTQYDQQASYIRSMQQDIGSDMLSSSIRTMRREIQSELFSLCSEITNKNGLGDTTTISASPSGYKHLIQKLKNDTGLYNLAEHSKNLLVELYDPTFRCIISGNVTKALDITLQMSQIIEGIPQAHPIQSLNSLQRALTAYDNYVPTSAKSIALSFIYKIGSAIAKLQK